MIINNTAPTFRVGDGKVITDFGATSAAGRGVTVQSDGKIIVAGVVDIGRFRFALARYNSDGSLDSTFGDGGKVVTRAIAGDDFAESVTLQIDGKIVVGGYGDQVLTLARYSSDGTLDTTFGESAFSSADPLLRIGTVTTNMGSDSCPYGKSVVMQADGKILLAGYSSLWGFDPDFTLVRYNDDGSLDESFGVNGLVVTDTGALSGGYGNSVTVQSDNKIIIAGTSNEAGTSNDNFTLLRYNTDGSLDTTFGAGGIVTTDFGSFESGNSVTQQSDGKIIVAGFVSSSLSDLKYAITF